MGIASHREAHLGGATLAAIIDGSLWAYPGMTMAIPRARHQLRVKALLGKGCRAQSCNLARGYNRFETRILAVIDDSP